MFYRSLDDFDNINITEENLAEYQALLYEEFGNPHDFNSKLYEGDDECYTEEEMVLENLYPVDIRPKEREVWKCIYPFRDKDNDDKFRRCLIYKIDNKLQAIYITSFDKNKRSKVKRSKLPWVKFLKDWNTRNEGLTKNSMVCGDIRCDFKNVKFIKKVGELTDRDYIQATIAITTFNKLKFSNQWTFLAWCINNYVTDTIPVDSSGNNNHNPMQSLYDIEKSKEANCVDLATAVHTISLNRRNKHYIVILRFYDKCLDNWQGHVYTMFQTKGLWRVFDYYRSKDEPSGEIRTYTQKNADEVMKEEAKLLMPAISKESFNNSNINYLNDVVYGNQLTKWDNMVKAKKTQEEVLYEFSNDFFKREKMEGYSYQKDKQSKPIQGTYEECMNVFKSLSEKEKDWFGGEFKYFPNAVVYRKFVKDGNQLVGFCELDDANKLPNGINGDVVFSVAIKKEYRRRGIARKMLADAIRWFYNSKYESFTYRVDKDNTASINLAKSLGLTKIEENYVFREIRDKEYVYVIYKTPVEYMLIGESVEDNGYNIDILYNLFDI